MENLENFQNLSSGLSANQDLKELIAKVYRENLDHLSLLNDLFEELQESNCFGMEKKIEETSDKIFQFNSLLSELRFARYLIRNGKSVRFLPQDSMSEKRSPDMLVNNENEAYLEVKRFTEDKTLSMVIEFLREFLAELDHAFVVDGKLKDNLSTITTGQERGSKKKLAKKTLENFKKRFYETDLSTLPTKIETEEAIFEIDECVDREVGYPRKVSTKGQFVPKDVKKKLCNDLIDRAKKRNDWEGQHRENFYFIGTDFEYWAYNERTLKSTLFGNTASVKEPLPMPELELPSSVRDVSKKGWKPLLLEYKLIPNDRSYVDLDNQGIYISRSEMKNVSGVIGSYPNGGFSFFPNPFAEDQINDPDLMNYLRS